MVKLLSSVVFLLLWMTLCFAKKGFILTAPKLIDAGSTEYFTFTAFDVPPGGLVSLKLLNYYTNTLLAESEVNVLNNMNMWVEMEVPPIPAVTKAKLQVQGNFSDGYRIKAEREVHIRHSSVLTFVQTDKPIYKPGQTVKFRILPMDSQLRTLEANTVGDVWIEDPSGIRVAQWRNVEFKEGMVQLELPLSNEPPLGTWNIKTVINEVNTAQDFEVEKYVLPKFEVSIKPPSIIMADAETIPVEICAWYTFGKKVDGKLKTRVSYKRMSWDSKQIPSVEQSGLISGCYNITVNTNSLQMHTGQYHNRALEIFAEVIENGTEIVINETIIKNVIKSPLTIEFLGTEDADYFKPGIPFYGQVQVRKPDGEAATSEKIFICIYDRNRQRDVPRWSPYGTDDDNNRCQRYTTNKKGRFRFSIAPQPSTVTKLTLVAEAVKHESQHYEGMNYLKKIEKPQATLILRPWYSPSGNYLQIQSAPDEMECDKMHRVKVRYTGQKGASIKFYHKVISRGRIVQQGSHQRTFYSKDESVNRRYDFEALHNSGSNGRSHYPLRQSSTVTSNNETTSVSEIGEFDLSFDPRATMSPVARLLIYYVREDGEVVADSRKFRITKCLLNKVNLHFRHEQQYPSTEASLLLSATPSSVCGIGLVDKSVLLLKSEKQFNIEKIFEMMKGFDVDKSTKPLQVSDDYCSEKVEVLDNPPPLMFDAEGARPENRFPIRRARYLSRLESYHADTSMAFEEAGMVAITDFELETRPCQNREPIAFELSELSERGRTARRKGYMRTAHLAMPIRSELPGITPLKSNEPQPETPPIEEIRNYFPETWLWEMHTVGGSGESALRRKLPHTITQWTGRAVCVHPKTGLGISDDAKITAFQPFFVGFRLPYSIVRGEILPLIVTVFNYLTECLPIKLSLESSEEYKILSESGSHKVCVCGGQSASHKFVLKPTALGMVNVTVYGYSLEDDDEVCGNEITARLSARDAVSKQLKVEAEGIPKEEVTNYFICPRNTNGSYATEIDLIPPDDVVEGSARAFISISADLMAPALNSLQELVNLPVGCGEQNMILFTPNIFVLDYLTATARKTQDIENECIKNMKIGYQRELNYRHKDGSYSAFGERDKEGSLWLTSFVVKSFGQATRFIDIDRQDIQTSIHWILGNQFENGCFQPIGTLHHKDMKGGLTEGEHSLSPLTAYVLIAMIESGLIRIDQDEAKNAVKCLKEDVNPNLYALSLYAYACALMKQNTTALKYLKLLDDRAFNVGGLRHWSLEGKGQKSKSVSVEVAGYYILARIELENEESTESVLPVVRWVAKQRNSKGGFISTQDTIIALQALSRYASIQTQEEAVDLGLAVEADGLVKGFKLNEENKLVTQKMHIPEIPTVVDLQAVGEGCALIQFAFRYNVERAVGSDAFDLNIDVVRVGSSECNLPRIGICMRYKIPNQTSNMVVVYVKMASGFTPDDESLNKLHSETNISLKRYDVEENMINFYFDQLTNEQTCFTFYVRNELEVEDIRPATIMIQDYYTPELQVTKEYSIPSACSVPGLPELPRLPPLVIGSDDDEPLPTPENDIDISTSVTISETETIEVTPEIPTTLEDNYTNTVTEYIDTTITPEVSTSTDVTDRPSVGTTGTVYEEVSSDAMTTIAVQNGTPTEPSDSMDVELGDDSFSLLMNENSSRFSNFINVDHDLEVPDGIEGVVPVTILPPRQTSSGEPDCPVCSMEYPENFEEIYCESAFVLKVRQVDADSVRILQDISPVHAKPMTVKKFASLLYDKQCKCSPLLLRGSFLLITGDDETLWVKDKQQEIHLKRGVRVIVSSSRTVAQSNKMRNERITCTDDP